MVKNVFFMLIVLVIMTGCSDEPGEITLEIDDFDITSEEGAATANEQQDEVEEVVEEDVDSTEEEFSEYTIEDFFTAIGLMNSWQSYVSNYNFIADYASEDRYDEETNSESHVITSPLQMYIYSHTINFSNAITEYYITPEFSLLNWDMSGWEKTLDTFEFSHELPSLIELLEQYLYTAEDVMIMEEGDIISASGLISENEKERIFAQTQTAIMFNTTQEEIPEEGFPLLESDEYLHDIYFYILLDKETGHISSYYVTIDFTTDDADEYDIWSFYSSFSNINEIDVIEIPEEVLREAGI